MADYWKSTERYWCKHCRVYVRDTPLEKRNHEATTQHQNGVKRALRDIHRGHERDERDKERARAEVERLNGLVSGTRPPPSSSFSSSSSTAAAAGRPARTGGDEEERKKRLEELAGLGVAMPTEVRGDMAMAGEWTVTSTKVIEERGEEEEVARKAVGVRKREVTEEEREEEEAVRGLFKKRKGWGRDVKRMPGEKDKELEDLLSGDLGGREVKREVKTEVKAKDGDAKVKVEVKEEEGVEKAEEGGEPAVKTEEGGPAIKAEEGEEPGLPAEPAKEEAESAAPAPVFKKRKAKNIRQR